MSKKNTSKKDEVMEAIIELLEKEESVKVKSSISQEFLLKAKELDAITSQDVIQTRMLFDVKVQ